ncbi:hypothetical protein JCGZ_01091 [Jatropha curcas]|uniref:Protein ECERIFERUM 26-like n=1 Tax=Jatropha curcas TaxID=180498 RepID=A0A067L5G0_JATCU|nr:protein ECERIFERUM 26 [Jatropha curcas]KDP39334.1 hypothetical protein JCGZ_01091 [Jatropha curcas]
MVSSNAQTLVYNLKISSVGPGWATDSEAVHEPNSIDLAMKLHYLKSVYFFCSEACQGLTISCLKESMFYWLNDYYITCGRFRRNDAGRPYLKCNDCGIRMIEAECDTSLDEWLELKDSSLNDMLVYHLPIGPELSFSPPVYFQATKFKCGGLSFGLSWAHILGDPFSASYYMNMLSPFLAGVRSNRPVKVTKQPKTLGKSENIKAPPLSLKRVDPVGDHWVTANNCKMQTFSLYLTASQVSHLLSNMWGQSPNKETPLFESLCAIIWQCIAKVREGHDPKIVTICKKDPTNPENEILSNNQIISSAKADFSIIDSNLKKLAMLLVDGAIDERDQIDETVENNDGSLDYIVYGANLTFINLENANSYELELNGFKPKFVYHTIQGVGDEGAVLLFPWPEYCDKYDDKGRVVTIISPEKEVIKLKSELKKIGLILESDIE